MKLGLLAGLAIVIALVLWQGVADLIDILAGAGWGILLVSLFIPPDLLLRSASLQVLFTPNRSPRYKDTVFATWIGASVNFLLPVATVGGEIVKARILVLHGTQSIDAAASVVLDKTVQATSVLLWAVIGIVILISKVPANEPTVLVAIVGATLLTLGIAGFVVVQWTGAFGMFAKSITRLSNGSFRSLVDNAADLDATVRALYRRPGILVMSSLLRLARHIVIAAEVWVVAWLIGYPIGFAEAVMLNSLAVALRSAAFVVPAGIGVQEIGYIVIGALIGIPSDAMLAVSLMTRLGRLIESLPGLLAWQHTEGKNYRRRQAEATSLESTVVSPPPPF
ncbi:MAG: lysylphosphatidylglycerol synthase domain-containing protein [Rhodospirillales bacterium]